MYAGNERRQERPNMIEVWADFYANIDDGNIIVQ